MKKHILLIVISITYILSGFSQEKRSIHYDFDIGERAPIFVSYLGNLGIYPGAKLGFNWNLLLIEKTKEKRRFIKTTRKVLYVSPNIAYYVHPSAEQGLFIKADLSWRIYTKRLFYYDFSLGAGYFRQFNTSETWQTNEDGTVSNIGISSRGYFDYSLSFAFGKQLPSKSGNPITIYARINSDVLVGYNAASIPEPSLELGIIFTPAWGIKTAKVKTIFKNKLR